MINKSFTVFRGYQAIKTFYINQTVNGVTTPYDMTAKTLELRVFDRSAIPVLQYNISPSNRGIGFCTFTFSNAQTNLLIPQDYFIIEAPGGTEIVLSYGVISPVDINDYIPFNDILSTEVPEGIQLSEQFIAVKSHEWRLMLQHAIDPHIADADVNNEEAWPVLMNYLIAKLVVYSYILSVMRGATISPYVASGSTVNAGVKKIETGPSNVEFFDSSNSLGNMLKPNAQGKTGFDTMKQDICTLAGKLRVNLPDICGALPEEPTIPWYVGRPEQLTALEFLQNQYGL